MLYNILAHTATNTPLSIHWLTPEGWTPKLYVEATAPEFINAGMRETLSFAEFLPEARMQFRFRTENAPWSDWWDFRVCDFYYMTGIEESWPSAEKVWGAYFVSGDAGQVYDQWNRVKKATEALKTGGRGSWKRGYKARLEQRKRKLLKLGFSKTRGLLHYKSWRATPVHNAWIFSNGQYQLQVHERKLKIATEMLDKLEA